MRVLNEAEATAFLVENGLGEQLTHLGRENAHTEFTTDVGRRCAYANLLTNHLVTSDESVACLDITDWGVSVPEHPLHFGPGTSVTSPLRS